MPPSLPSSVLRYMRERELLRPGDRVCVAVSGGADSVALLRILLELGPELGIVPLVAHINHGLRGEASDGDEAFVEGLARHHSLDFFCGQERVAEHPLARKLGVEGAARELRYRFFVEIAAQQRADAVATGHTLDDQAETVLLKFLRGAGTRGLAGIYPVIDVPCEHAGELERQDNDLVSNDGIPSNSGQKFTSATSELRRSGSAVSPGRESWVKANGEPESRRDDTNTSTFDGHLEDQESQTQVRIVRPLLLTTRAEVEAYLESLGQPWREDESNLDHRFARNRIRHELLPLLERDYNPNLRRLLSDSAEVARAEEEYWQALVAQELQRRSSEPREIALAGIAGLPLALQRRLFKAFAESNGIAADFDHIEKLRHCAIGDLAKTKLPGGWLAERKGDFLLLNPPGAAPPPAIDYEYTLPIPGRVTIPHIGLELRATLLAEEDAEPQAAGNNLLNAALVGAELTVRNWRPGDRFWPAHRGSEEKLKRLFAEEHIPAEQRPGWPVALQGQQIVWVNGLPGSHSHAWQGRGDAIKIELHDPRRPSRPKLKQP